MNRNECFFVSFVLVVALLLGCGGGGGGGGSGSLNPASPATTGEFVDFGGKVSYNGSPMSGAAVYLITPAKALESGLAQNAKGITGSIRLDSGFGNGYWDYQTLSGPEGSFQFSKVAAGVYTLVAVKDGRQAVKTNLTVNAAITTVDVALAPTGNVKGIAGIPGSTDQSTILVYLEGTSYVALTSPTGSFSLFNVPAGSYSLQAKRGIHGISSPVSVTVLPGQDVTVPTLQLASSTDTTATTTVPMGPGIISGTATKVGQTLAGGIIAYLQGTQYVALTDSTGAYRFHEVPTGNYTLTFMAEGFSSPAPQTVTVTSGQTTSVALATLTPTSPGLTTGGLLGKVSKTATVSNTETNQISLRISSGTYEKLTVSASDGSFGFYQVPLGTYNFEVLDSSYVLASGATVQVQATNPATDYGTFAVNTTVSGVSRIEGNLAVLPGGSYLSGDILLYQQGISGPVKVTQMGTNSSFSFSGLTAGSYQIQVDPYTGYKVSPNSFFTVGNADRILKPNLPLTPTDVSIVSFQVNGAGGLTPSLAVAGGVDITTSFQIVLKKQGVEHFLTSVTPPAGFTLAGNLTSIPPGKYELYLYNATFDFFSNSASTTVNLLPPQIDATTISPTVSLGEIRVGWTGVPNAASYAVNIYTNNNGTTPAYSSTDIYETEVTIDIPNTITNFRVGVTAHANGVFSSETLNSSWLPFQSPIAAVNPVKYTNSGVTNSREAYAANGYVYFFWNSFILSNYSEYVEKISPTTGTSAASRQFYNGALAPAPRGYVTQSQGIIGVVGTTGTTYANRLDYNLNILNTQSVAISPSGNPVLTHNPANGDFFIGLYDNTNFYLLNGNNNLSTALSQTTIESFGATAVLKYMIYSPDTSFTGPCLLYYHGSGYGMTRYSDTGTRLASQTVSSSFNYTDLNAIGNNILMGAWASPAFISKLYPSNLTAFSRMEGPGIPVDFTVDGKKRIWVFGANNVGEVFIYSEDGTLLDYRSTGPVGNSVNNTNNYKYISYDSSTSKVVLFYETNVAGQYDIYTFDASF